MGNFNFERNEIHGSVFENAIIVNDSNNLERSESSKTKSLNEYLDELIAISPYHKEVTCAKRIKKLYVNKKEEELKKFLKSNFKTITTGTFANVAGGLLVEMLKKILWVLLLKLVNFENGYDLFLVHCYNMI